MDGIEYLDPYADPALPAEPYRLRLDRSIKEPRIAMLSNLFTDATPFLNDLEIHLRPLLSEAAILHYDKGHVRNASFPVVPERVNELCSECDAIVMAYGHCGSCTAGTIRDAINFAHAGKPVVALVTTRFVDESRFLLRAGGLPDIPLVVLPHPVAGRDAEFHTRLAEVIAPDVISALYDGISSNRSLTPGVI